MTAFVDPMYPYASIVVPPHFSQANIAPESKYTYLSSAQSIDTPIYPPKQITITYPEITHPRVHHVSANIDLDIEHYIPIQYDLKFPHVNSPRSPIALESSSQSETTAIPCIDLSNSQNAHPQAIGSSYGLNPMVAWQSMNIMQGRISFKFQDLPERRLGSRSLIIWRFGKELFQSYCCQ
jgi:hypothetical protein